MEKTEKNRLGMIKQFLVNAKAHALFPSSDAESHSRFSTAMDELNRAWEMFYPGQAFTVEPVSGETHRRHHISPSGYYRGKKVVKTKADE